MAQLLRGFLWITAFNAVGSSALTGGLEFYDWKNKNKHTPINTTCKKRALTGALNGFAFGLLWPITLPMAFLNDIKKLEK